MSNDSMNIPSRFRFRKDTIDSIVPPEKPKEGHGRDTYHDTQEQNLKLRVADSGSKVFYYYGKHNGRARWHKLGPYPRMTVSQARRQCREKAAIYLQGGNPDIPKADRTTFGEVFKRYMSEYAMPRKKTWKEDQRKHDMLFAHWDSRRMDSFTKSQITNFHTKLKNERGPYLANRCLALLSGIFRFACNTLEMKVNNPCKDVEKFPETERDRYLNADELRRFFEALESSATEVMWRDFFALAVWTGARRANIQAMAWEHIDLRAGLWEIPGEQFKNGAPFTVYLSKPALKILTRRKLECDGTSPYVFPSKSKQGHVVEPRAAWKNLLKRAGLAKIIREEYVDSKGKTRTRETVHPQVRIHDLRRTLGSWQAASGASLQVIGRTLGHKDTQTTEIYARLDLDPVRASVNTATAAMMEAIGGRAKEESAEETDD